MKNITVYLMLLGFALFTGSTFPIAKYTVDYFSPLSAAGWRFGIASVIMLILLVGTEGVKRNVLRSNALAYLVIGVIGVFGFNALFFLGLKYTTPINGALIMGTNPVITTILARLILKDVITKGQLIGIMFAFVGVVLVITEGSIETITHLSFAIGDVIILLGNVCWACYSVLGRKLIKGSSSLETTTYTMVIGTVCLVIASLFVPSPVHLSDVTVGAWGGIAFMAIFTSVLGYLWWNQGMKKIGPGKTSLFFNLVPVVTMLVSYVLGSSITLFQLLGVFFVVVGVLTASGILRIVPFFQKPTKSEAI